MANLLTSFLVGIGFDTSKFDAGLRNVDRGMSQVQGTVLKTSAVLVGAFGLAANSIVSTANRVDQLALKTANMRTSQQYIYNYGNALKFLGGNAEDALSVVTTIESALNNLRLKGELGPLQDLALAGVDISQLTGAANAQDFITALSAQMPGLDKTQRGAVQSALGLSDAALKSLVSGPAALDAALKRSEDITGNLDGLVENSRKLMESSAQFDLVLEGTTNELADKFLPSIVGASEWINKFLTDNRGTISEAIGYAAENAGATAAIGGGASAALIGAGASKLGAKAVGGAVTKAGTAGMVVGGSAIASDILNETLNKYVPGYGEASRGFDKAIMAVTGLERIPSPLEVLFGGMSPSDTAVKPDTAIREQERQMTAAAIAGAVSKVPLSVTNNLTLQLDGQALDAKIVDVTERTAYSTMDDITSTTAR